MPRPSLVRRPAARWGRLPSGPAPELDGQPPEAAVSARVSSALLGGKDHWPRDRDAAQRLCELDPSWARDAAAARAAVLGLAAATRGIDQFVDLGCGLTTGAADSALAPLHTAVGPRHPGAHVVYADRDPMVLAHTRALLHPPAPATARHLEADLTDPVALLAALRHEAGLQWRRPVAVLLSDVLHELTDAQARPLLAALRDDLPDGSVLLLTHRLPAEGATAAAVATAHTEAALAWHPRAADQLTALLPGWRALPLAHTTRTPGFTTLAVTTGRRPA
ncbi:SAM-dependent methyltransferase [Kitasatospora camelliae]|uniref:SAM-dependent methyltransferase n=1 Tax=Kitasatospora camelliae TaxID=3156397 RepID=A0AAU8JR04_9ACTN